MGSLGIPAPAPGPYFETPESIEIAAGNRYTSMCMDGWRDKSNLGGKAAQFLCN